MNIKRGAVVALAATALMGLTLPAHAGGDGNGNGNGGGADVNVLGVTEQECTGAGGMVDGSNCVFPGGGSQPIVG